VPKPENTGRDPQGIGPLEYPKRRSAPEDVDKASDAQRQDNVEQDTARALPRSMEPSPPLVIRLHRGLKIATPNKI